MQRKLVSSLALALALLAFGASLPAAAQVQFIPLEATCGPVFFPTFCVVDMAGDGNTLLFRDKVWNAATGYQAIGPAGMFSAIALSDDGKTVVGDYYVTDGPLGPHIEAAIWQGGDTWRPLGGLPGAVPCGSDYSSAYDVSNDGKVVGLAWVGAPCSGGHAFEWTEATGMVDKGSIVADRSSRANAIAADGSKIVGWSDSDFGSRLAAHWTGDAPATWFSPDGNPIYVGEAQGVSSDGSFVVGGGYGDYTNPLKPKKVNQAWLWSAATNTIVPLGVVKQLTGDFADGQHWVSDVSDDGAVVVGQDMLYNLGEQWAFIWTKQAGISMLQDYIRAHTDATTKAKLCPALRTKLLPCHGWDLWNVAAVSNDGKTIVGTGANPDGIFQAFMVKLP